MKYMLFFCWLLLGATAGSHAQSANASLYRGFVNYQPGAAQGMIILTSTGFGKKKADGIKDACQQAFSALLFRGIPGSPCELPLIPASANQQAHPAVKKLLEEQGYMAFITESAIEKEEKKQKRKDGAAGLMITQRITINYEALRQHLEQNQVIRKFGI